MTDAAPTTSLREEIAPLGPNEARLYVNNLPWSQTNETLAQWIQQQINVSPIEVSIVQDKRFERSRGYGFIKINKGDLNKCLTLNGQHIDGRDIGVQEAQQRTEEEREKHREAQKAKRDAKRAEKQAQQPAAAVAQASSPAAVQSKKAAAPKAPKTPVKQFENATTIHITNLAFKVDEPALTAYVQSAIGVAPLDVSIPVRKGKFRTGQSMGYGFVTVPNDKADAALALDGQTYEERPLKVSLSRPQQTDSAADEQAGDAEAQPQRPRQRNARRARGGRGGAAAGTEANGAAAASPSGATPESSPAGAAAAGKRGRGRGRRAPRAGAEDGAQ